MGRPVKEFRMGQIKAAVWENEFDGKKGYSVSLNKSYKAKNGEWKDTQFYNDKDLKDIIILFTAMLTNKVKSKDNTQQQQNSGAGDPPPF